MHGAVHSVRHISCPFSDKSVLWSWRRTVQHVREHRRPLRNRLLRSDAVQHLLAALLWRNSSVGTADYIHHPRNWALLFRERYRSGSYADQCCGNDVLRFGQTCCEGTVTISIFRLLTPYWTLEGLILCPFRVDSPQDPLIQVHNVVSGDCCGQAVYSKSDSSFLCCNGNLTR